MCCDFYLWAGRAKSCKMGTLSGEPPDGRTITQPRPGRTHPRHTDTPGAVSDNDGPIGSTTTFPQSPCWNEETAQPKPKLLEDPAVDSLVSVSGASRNPELAEESEQVYHQSTEPEAAASGSLRSDMPPEHQD